MFYSRESGRHALQSWIRVACRDANRSDRKKTAESFSAGHARVFDGHGRLQHGLLFLPELGHLQIALRSSAFQYVPAEDVVALAIEHGCPSIAFTYNEPTIWGEYVIDICHAARERGIATVMVSNGYITREAFHDIYDHVDAANIDLKAFTEDFYGRITLTHLKPVLDMLEWLKNETNVWFEITNLIIPTLNDGAREIHELSEWVLEHLGPDVPLHFTAFHPDFKLRDKPPTPPETLHAARRIALETGLHYVYEGNILHGAGETICPKCGVVLLRRSWHTVATNRLQNGACFSCGTTIPGRWTMPGATDSAANRRDAARVARKYETLNL